MAQYHNTRCQGPRYVSTTGKGEISKAIPHRPPSTQGNRGGPVWHFNAENGALKRFHHTRLPGAARYAKGGAKGLIVVGLALDAYDIYTSVQADQGEFGPNTKHAVGRVAGGWGGALAGVLAGAAIGSAVPVVGTAVGAFVGAVIGGVGGSFLGDWASELF